MPSSPLDTTRNRSNSEEDAELPTHDRKRARLSESGDREGVLPRLTEPMSTQTPDSTVASALHPFPAEPVAKPPLPPRTSETMATPSPTSKVTINTRPLSSQSMNMTDISPPTEPSESPAVDVEQPPTSDGEHKPDVNATMSDKQTVGRSPSPPIDAAEPEDFDQDPAQTRWTTHMGASVPTIQPYHVYQTFPLASTHAPNEGRQNLLQIARVFGDSRKDDVDIFHQVKDWLSDFTSRCDVLTQEIVNEDPSFWRGVYLLLDKLCQRDQRTPSPINFKDMAEFFVAYGRLCRLFLEYDTATLSSLRSSQTSEDVILFSAAYLQPFSRIVEWVFLSGHENRSPLFFDSLRRYHHFDLAVLLKPVAESLAQPLLASLIKYLEALGPVLSKVPTPHKDVLNISSFLGLAAQLVCPVYFTWDHCLLASGHPLNDEVREQVETALKLLDEVIQLGIKKQHAWLSLENKALTIIERVNWTMLRLAPEIPRLGKSIIHAAGVTYDDTDLTDLAWTMRYAWKFMIYFKFIKHGRMELRVSGLHNLCTDLIAIHTAANQPYRDGNQDPAVKFTIRFLRENDVVNYLVGPDSHPQLISRAGNVLGFFGVTGNYDDADTDSIWQVIVDSSDARGAAEFWSMLRDALTTLETQHLYHICGKLCDLPYSRWSPQILNFTEQLLGHALHQKLYSDQIFWRRTLVDGVVRRLILKLVRDSLRPTCCQSELSMAVRHAYIQHWLNYFKGVGDDPTKLSMPVAEESELLQDIRSDIESHSHTACGSIFAVFEILRSNRLNAAGIHAVIETCGFPRILIDDLAHFSTSGTAHQASQQPFVLFECRLDCLALLMQNVPEEFDLECLESLWTSVLVSSQVDQKVRDRAWSRITMLVGTFRPQKNAVVENILQHFWSRLRPTDMNDAVLNLAKSGVAYETAFAPDSPASGDQEIVQIPGLDRIRQIMLDAEPGTVEAAAGEYMIEQYLRNPILTRCSKEVVHATHLNLIDHWVGAVLASAARLKSMAENGGTTEMLATDDEIRTEERHFDRSLLFLRRFTEAIKGNPGCSPLSPKQEAALPDFPGVKGTPRNLVVEIGSSKYFDKSDKRVSVGSENTGSELWEYLATITGFSSFRTFHLGQLIALQNEHRTIEDLNITAKVQVQKTPDATESTPRKRFRSSSPVDEKIMLHFDDLYSLLEADDRLAREVYTFLTITSVRKEVSHMIRGMETPASLVLPCEKPYKLLFCVQALRTCIEEESFSTDPDLEFVRYTVQALGVAFATLSSIGLDTTLRLLVAFELLDTMLLALRSKVPHGTGKEYISDHAKFVQQTVGYTSIVQQVGGAALLPQSPEKPVRVGIEVLVEASLHDNRICETLVADEAFANVLRNALVVDRNEVVRQSVVEVLMGMTGQAGLKNLPKANDPRAARSRHDATTIESCLLHIWPLLVAMLPVAQTMSFQCQQYFDATHGTLRRIGRALTTETLAELLPVCSSSLLSHTHVEVVGQPLADRFVGGVALVIQEIARLLRSRQTLSKQTNLLQGIIAKYLRPPLSAAGCMSAPLPILDTGVRESLYTLLLTLSHDEADMDMLIAEFGEDFDLSDYLPVRALNERLSLRSEVGYGGLRNLSNTCYLNSLFTQLFMNIQFRELIIKYGAENRDRGLVWELSKVFSFMQGTFNKCADPINAVESITQWDGDQIDVTVQMDVDEFFNLLFDRLENEISDPAIRSQMKSLYGGETIQQIKSKECEHISERPETFSVLPVEIKGKASLQESLQAYVAGEVLQGENKYSCTSCGKHVDAVKRSCLKHVPDNLIFNLKRFDFDLVNFVRAKLNDQFEFPETLDMAPYQLDSLDKSDVTPDPDVFELTGIIVHSGTAETGHYYSYIRQRPSSSDSNDSWIEFNDADVSVFDPNRVADCCFGGADPSMYNFTRYYNAYMLFYQRRSSIQETTARFQSIEPGQPLRLDVAPDLKEYINQANELFVRAYCMQDPVHARFIRDLLKAVGDIDSGVCSQSHEREKAALSMALDYMHKVSSRWKTLPDLESTGAIIKTFAGRCTECALHCLSWFDQHAVVAECIVDGPYGNARKVFCDLLVTCLQLVQKSIDEQVTTGHRLFEFNEILTQIVTSLHETFGNATRTARCWPDYFPLIIHISEISLPALKLVVDTGFVARCFEIVYIHLLQNPSDPLEKLLRSNYSGYATLREKHRPFQHGYLAHCLSHLLAKVQLDVDWTRGEDDNKVYLPSVELAKMGLQRVPAQLGWLHRLIGGHFAPEPAVEMVKTIIAYEDFAPDVSKMLVAGLNHSDMVWAAAFVDPTIAACEHCPSKIVVADLVKKAIGSIGSISTDYAPEFFRLIEGLLKVGGVAEGERQEEGWLSTSIGLRLVKWAPILLVGHNETNGPVRNETAQLVNHFLIEPLEQAQDDDPARLAQLKEQARELCIDIAKTAQTNFLSHNPRENQTMQSGHFIEALDVMQRCREVVYADMTTAKEEQEYTFLEDVMHQLRSMRESVVELISPNDFDGSSDMEVLSEIDGDDFTSSPAA